MFGIGTQELLIIFLIVLLLFGANRIPEIGRALGKGIRDFKRATRDIEDEFDPRDQPRSPNRIAERRQGETPPETPHKTP
jgi:sec-independent protein translocase protein TatA